MIPAGREGPTIETERRPMPLLRQPLQLPGYQLDGHGTERLPLSAPVPQTIIAAVPVGLRIDGRDRTPPLSLHLLQPIQLLYHFDGTWDRQKNASPCPCSRESLVDDVPVGWRDRDRTPPPCLCSCNHC
ncbi:hypothetical protein AVEN_142622-1 [Araneus ventricosus]|uniref:Uncharacterized protein n=1 Tax=Araneus ventricosus TaxID=182803 RepID=A0A4Y2G9N5_ARAVE|nr:hypothetical protein AVEN_142622-1 [Araneus ventricosus]